MGNIPPAHSQQAKRYADELPTSLRFQSDISRILANATHTIASIGTDFSNRGTLETFQGIVDDFTANVSSYGSRALALASLDRLYFTISALMLQALQFLKLLPTTHLSAWRPAFDAACELIHQLHDLEKTVHIDLYGTSFVYHGVLLAACTLLRCLKTPFSDTIGRDASTAQALFFSAINMIRNISLAEEDQPAKSAWALQQLWRSQSIYKKQDGTWDLDLHVRNRFSSSVIYDTMWWCRTEFAGQPNAFPNASSEYRGPFLPAVTNRVEQNLFSVVIITLGAMMGLSQTLMQREPCLRIGSWASKRKRYRLLSWEDGVIRLTQHS